MLFHIERHKLAGQCIEDTAHKLKWHLDAPQVEVDAGKHEGLLV